MSAIIKQLSEEYKELGILKRISVLMAFNKFRKLTVGEAYYVYSYVAKDYQKLFGTLLKAADVAYGADKEKNIHSSNRLYRIEDVFYKSNNSYYKPLFYGIYFGSYADKGQVQPGHRNDYRVSITYDKFIELIKGKEGNRLIVSKLIEDKNFASFKFIDGQMVPKFNRVEINRDDIKVFNIREVDKETFKFYYQKNQEMFKEFFNIVNEKYLTQRIDKVVESAKNGSAELESEIKEIKANLNLGAKLEKTKN